MTEILVTAGPTREYLDDVRFLSNGSTGRMGYAIAGEAQRRGCTVTLVSGPTALPTPAGVRRVDVVSGREMLEAASRAFESCDIAFFVAAVADHHPARRDAGKPAKERGSYRLELVPNPDIAATLGARKGRRISVGFALEASGGEACVGDPAVGAADLAAPGAGEARTDAAALGRARAKMRRKHFDLCVLNPPAALGSVSSCVTLLDGEDGVEHLPPMDKAASAAVIVARALALAARQQPETGARSE